MADSKWNQPAEMENVNEIPDSHRIESDLCPSDGDLDYFNESGRYIRMRMAPSDETLFDISNSMASLTASPVVNSHDEDRPNINLNAFRSHGENVDTVPYQTFNFNEASASLADFTCYQHKHESNFKYCDITEPFISQEGCSANVLSSEDEPSTSKVDLAVNSTNDLGFNVVDHSACRHKSREGQIGLQIRLMQAINHEDLATVRQLLYIDKLDPNFSMNMKNPICLATTLGNVNVMKLLLDRGAYPDTPNASDLLWERHPIHIAASKGHLSAMQLLIKNGAFINQPDNDRRTPLHWAAMYGQADMVTWMLDAGATINSTQTDGFTPLHTATCLGNREVCRLLIDGGADLFYRDCEGWTPLHTAVCYGYIEIVILLLDKGACPLVTTGMNEDTTLHLACTKGRWDIAELMLRKGVPIESRNSYGFTPLLSAVFYNRVDLALHLVKSGANVNAVNYAGTSSIYLSAVRCELDLIKLLLLAGCKVPKHLSLPVSQHTQTLAAEMEFNSSSPQKLIDQCLVVIRQSLAPDLQSKGFLLPLPEVLKRELVMKNISTTEVSLFP